MAKVNQRLWKIPGQRAKRKAWGYTVQVVEEGKRVQKRVYKSEWTKEDAELALAACESGMLKMSPETAKAELKKADGVRLGVHARREERGESRSPALGDGEPHQQEGGDVVHRWSSTCEHGAAAGRRARAADA